jgi:dihydroorotate dehydrogenase electron transfer subunit
MDYLEARISKMEYPASGHALLSFVAKRPVRGEPGQFVMVRGEWGSHPMLPRAFSLVETGEEGAILIRVIGEGTRLLYDMKPGDPLWVLGPLGRGFDFKDKTLRPVLVAGGVGVAPLLFLAERLASEKQRPVFIYGARTYGDLALRERLSSVSDLVVTTEDGSSGEKGLATDALKRCLEDGTPSQIFACGPQAMLEAVAGAAGKARVRCEVALESPMACGTGVCKGCAIETAEGDYRYVCSDGPVFDAVEIYGGAK